MGNFRGLGRGYIWLCDDVFFPTRNVCAGDCCFLRNGNPSLGDTCIERVGNTNLERRQPYGTSERVVVPRPLLDWHNTSRHGRNLGRTLTEAPARIHLDSVSFLFWLIFPYTNEVQQGVRK
ncbi:hypothetical protein MPL3365_30325 [Mesorhizobium plurifarium]|uniref:Uncharacterized protein n=1 Tax=Mesorhizobium plurifarium TaxID=69974 RepID=A0A090G7Z0_MESPL|nr:hypothetical protein MPL3365_30325 [Mesorhizobium plurifarium]